VNEPEEHFGDQSSCSYSDVEGGQAGVVMADNAVMNWEEGNVDLDPMLGEDYHLTAASPCIDLGDPDFVPGADQTDIDGDPRSLDGDGDTDYLDLVVLLNHYGEVCE